MSLYNPRHAPGPGSLPDRGNSSIPSSPYGEDRHTDTGPSCVSSPSLHYTYGPAPQCDVCHAPGPQFFHDHACPMASGSSLSDSTLVPLAEEGLFNDFSFNSSSPEVKLIPLFLPTYSETIRTGPVVVGRGVGA